SNISYSIKIPPSKFESARGETKNRHILSKNNIRAPVDETGPSPIKTFTSLYPSQSLPVSLPTGDFPFALAGHFHRPFRHQYLRADVADLWVLQPFHYFETVLPN
ncbi:MAG: hypothetical protein LBT65_10365, partial [Synergistaceae bacterium]|nr:hypothetical protein [Synergistaceae bacterium]